MIIQSIIERKGKRPANGAGKTAATVSIAAIAILPLLMSGCVSGPNYQRPETNVEANFVNANQPGVLAGAVDAAWWRGFHDAQLNELIADAFQSNLDLKIATANVLEARAMRQEAEFDFLPTLGTKGGWTKSTTSKDSMGGNFARSMRQHELFNAGFDATWEMDLFGRVRRANEISHAQLAMAQAQRRDVMVTLASEIARNYFELRGGQNRLSVALENANNQKQTLELTESKLRAGRATELDTARGRAQYNATLAAIPPIQVAIKRTLHRLSVLTGRQPSALDARLSAVAPLPSLPILATIDNPETLLRRRSDVRMAEHQLEAATAAIGIATADLFPRVTFNGRIGFEATHLASIGKSGSDTYSFGPSITWAALDYGRVRARMKASRAQADAALAYYERAVLTVLEETENALVDYGQTQVRRDYLAASAKAAEEAVNLARNRYNGGVADFLTVLDAQRVQLDIQDQLAQSQTATATRLVAVYKALGGGWETEITPTSAKEGKTATK
jgi:multidrug efflux system outer membrane protein